MQLQVLVGSYRNQDRQKLVFIFKQWVVHNKDVAKTKKYFCAFCSTPRVQYSKRHLSVLDFGLAAFSSAVLMMLFWGQFDPRVVVIFVACIILGEIFVLFRYRLALRCPHCGFDPLLYKRDRNRAAQSVKAKLERRKADPMNFLKRPLDLPKIKRPPKQQSR